MLAVVISGLNILQRRRKGDTDVQPLSTPYDGAQRRGASQGCGVLSPATAKQADKSEQMVSGMWSYSCLERTHRG